MVDRSVLDARAILSAENQASSDIQVTELSTIQIDRIICPAY